MPRVIVAAILACALAAAASAQTAPPAPADPAHMSRQALQAEVAAARPLIQNGGVRAARNPGCTDAEHRQFDFWLGEWDVSPTGQDMLVAESTISVEDQGCTIMEYWRAFASGHGHSINGFDVRDQSWHQMWVDATGQVTQYRGKLEDGVMRLDNLSPPPPGAPATLRRRMNYQQLDPNTVRQWGERYDEASSQWVVAWSFTYHRRPGTHP